MSADGERNFGTNDLSAFWMPFTANRQFKKAPRLLASAKGNYYYSHDGRKVLDGTAGLWCVNAGHGRESITEAVSRQVATLDFAPTFQMGHPIAFELASRLAQITPPGLDHIFFANSGSEAVDSALKIALAYHRARGEGSRTRLIGRERGYHGVGFGGISVGGMVNNRKAFGPLLPGVDHLPHTLSIANAAYSKGQPDWGAHLADDLERIVALHDASTIAAVIVEPMAGSTGVLIPPKGYLEKLRAITEKHGILLIFDEVISGFGRLGASFASELFGVTPDLITVAKGITNAAVPMGAVFASNKVHDAFMNGPEHLIELFHGYTYSAHPVACAASLATLDIYRDEKLFDRAAAMAPYLENAVHGLKGTRHVMDIRNLGLVAAVELEPRAGLPTVRAYEAMVKCYELGVMIRTTGDVIAISPPLTIEKSEIDHLVETLRSVLSDLD
jgi:beta-alanine--pyruvate transaminase